MLGAHQTRPRSRRGPAAFTLTELMIVLAIMATIASIAVPRYRRLVGNAKEVVAVQQLEDIQNAIDLYEQQHGELPPDLEALGIGTLLDPWGNPYQYLNFSTIKGNGVGALRKDHALVPLNSTYDLYSMGPDGSTEPPLTAETSRDDIVRANDGDYIGPAMEY